MIVDSVYMDSPEHAAWVGVVWDVQVQCRCRQVQVQGQDLWAPR